MTEVKSGFPLWDLSVVNKRSSEKLFLEFKLKRLIAEKQTSAVVRRRIREERRETNIHAC